MPPRHELPISGRMRGRQAMAVRRLIPCALPRYASLCRRQAARVVTAVGHPPLLTAAMGVFYWLAHHTVASVHRRVIQMASPHHPSALRNRGPIVDTLRKVLPELEEGGAVLELASGSGCHAEHISEAFPKLDWQPSELTAEQQERLEEYFKASTNVRPALIIDAALPVEAWGVPLQSKTLVYASNVTHISPYEVTTGLIAGAAALLRPHGSLVIYGPFKVNGEFTTESNREFDENLKGRNAAWGYRNIEDLVEVAQSHGLRSVNTVPMPANNFLLQFVKD